PWQIGELRLGREEPLGPELLDHVPVRVGQAIQRLADDLGFGAAAAGGERLEFPVLMATEIHLLTDHWRAHTVQVYSAAFSTWSMLPTGVSFTASSSLNPARTP